MQVRSNHSSMGLLEKKNPPKKHLPTPSTTTISNVPKSTTRTGTGINHRPDLGPATPPGYDLSAVETGDPACMENLRGRSPDDGSPDAVTGKDWKDRREPRGARMPGEPHGAQVQRKAAGNPTELGRGESMWK